MPADGKWIAGLAAETPLGKAARRVFAARLAAVVKHWRPAVEQPIKTENVHQLRVATRRAAAALDIFGDLLPKKRYRRLRKKLHQLRDGAGAARDWDVFQIALFGWMTGRPDRERPGLDFLTGFAIAQRQSVQIGLNRTLRFQSQWGRLSQKTQRAIPKTKKITLDCRARKEIGRLVRELSTAAAYEPMDDAHLHQVRIAGKKLRYALEIFVGCFGTKMRDTVYPCVEDLQEILGRANDSRVTIDRLKEMRKALRKAQSVIWRRVRPGVLAWVVEHRRRLESERDNFRQWRKTWNQKTPGINQILSGTTNGCR